jgi:pimeloyl-ACP methyl ester carboxylesterase
MPLIDIGEFEVNYEIRGSRGDPLLMIMGLRFSLLDWGDDLPNELAKYHQVILFDNRDAGKTTTQSSGKKYSIADMADDVAGLIQALNISKVHVFGVSMGGMIAQQFALRHANKLDKLILGCTMAGGNCSISPNVVAFLKGDLLDLLFTPTQIATDRKELEAFLKKTSQYHSAQPGLMRQLHAIAQHDTCNELKDITAPTLIISGDSDQAIPSKNSEELSKRIPNSTLLPYLKDAGHGFVFTHAAETAEAIIKFLQ